MSSIARPQQKTFSATIARLFHRESSLGLIMITPAFVLLALLMAYPFTYAMYLSFTDKQVGGTANFVGFANYTKLFGTTLYSRTVINSVVYTVIALILKCLGGLALAVMLNRDFYGQRVLKALLLIPWIMPTVFSTMIWSWIFHPSFSVFNIVLVEKLGILSEPIPFLLSENWAMASLIFVNV